MNENKNLLELIKWLEGEKYLIDESSTTMTEEFEKVHKWELSRNRMINKTISKIEEMFYQEVYMKPVKEKIKIIDSDRGYFECKNSCDICKKNCKLIKELMEENK